ncbi:MAG: NACHT domain-containing protein [Candidatus Methanogasteraceae archaeon]
MLSISRRSILQVIAVGLWIIYIGCSIFKPELEPVAAALAGAIVLLLSFFVSNIPISSLTSEETKSAREKHNRQHMLELVKNSWVKDVLEQSLHEEVLIELGLEERRDAVLNRQGIELQRPGKPNRMLQPGAQIVDVFDEMGKTLLIIGEPGSGKTTMLLELARDTIARAEEDAKNRIPVVFNLSSWGGTKLIANWLVDELITKYYTPKETASDWVKNDEMLLLLDGLDEAELYEVSSNRRREACVKAINDFRREHGLTPLVVCCRIEEYEALTTRLDLEGAVSLQPLTKEQIDDYLDRIGQELASLRAALENDPILYELAQSPLMLSIMTLAYHGMSVDELEPLETVDARRKHIFDNYVERMFKPRAQRTFSDYPKTDSTPDWKQDGKRFSKEEAIHWLSWLAKRMSEHGQTIFMVERMQSDWLPTRAQQRIVTIGAAAMIGLLFGLSFGLVFRLPLGSVIGLLFGSAIGLFFGLVGYSVDIRPVELLHFSWSQIVPSLRGEELPHGLYVGLLFGLLFGGLACIQHVFLRIMLWRNGSAPLNYVRFLDCAADRIFLRKVGGGYIFVHRLLLEYFASLEPEESGN